MNILLNFIKEICVPKEFENISDNTIIVLSLIIIRIHRILYRRRKQLFFI